MSTFKCSTFAFAIIASWNACLGVSDFDNLRGGGAFGGDDGESSLTLDDDDVDFDFLTSIDCLLTVLLSTSALVASDWFVVSGVDIVG